MEECMENSKDAIMLALEDEKDRERFGIADDRVMIEYIMARRDDKCWVSTPWFHERNSMLS